MKLPTPATMKEDKWTGMKDTKKIVATKGETVSVYNIDHDPVYLCTNSRGVTFSVHKDSIRIK